MEQRYGRVERQDVFLKRKVCVLARLGERFQVRFMLRDGSIVHELYAETTVPASTCPVAARVL